MRIRSSDHPGHVLLDADPADGGGTATAEHGQDQQRQQQQPHDDFRRPPAAEGEHRQEARGGARDDEREHEGERKQADPAIESLRAELKQREEKAAALEAELAEFRKHRRDQQAERDRAEEEKLKQAGKWDELESRFQKRLDDVLAEREQERERNAKMIAESVVDRDLSDALSGFNWIEGGADLARQVLRPQLEAVERDGQYRTRSRDLKDIKEFVRDAIEGNPAMRNLTRIEDRGGAGSTTRKPAPEAGGGGGEEQDAGRRMIKAWRESAGTRSHGMLSVRRN